MISSSQLSQSQQSIISEDEDEYDDEEIDIYNGHQRQKNINIV